MNITIDFDSEGVSVIATLSRDGDQWCVLLGENLQCGIAGFGAQTRDAIEDFKSNFRNEQVVTNKIIKDKKQDEERTCEECYAVYGIQKDLPTYYRYAYYRYKGYCNEPISAKATGQQKAAWWCGYLSRQN